MSQLRRVLGKYHWGPDKPEPTRQEKRQCSFGYTDHDSWRLNVEAPVDEGALIEAALKAMRSELVKAADDAAGRAAVSYLDALLGLIDRADENDEAGERHHAEAAADAAEGVAARDGGTGFMRHRGQLTNTNSFELSSTFT